MATYYAILPCGSRVWFPDAQKLTKPNIFMSMNGTKTTATTLIAKNGISCFMRAPPAHKTLACEVASSGVTVFRSCEDSVIGLLFSDSSSSHFARGLWDYTIIIRVQEEMNPNLAISFIIRRKC